MKPTAVTLADWRAQVDKELAGAAFDKLITTTSEGLAIQPLYVEAGADPGLPGAAPFARGGSAAARPFQICMRVDPPGHRRPGALEEDVLGGADALWIQQGDSEAYELAARHGLAVVTEGRMAIPDGELALRELHAQMQEVRAEHGNAGDEDEDGEPEDGDDAQDDDQEDDGPSPRTDWLDFDYITAAARGRIPARILAVMVQNGLAAMAQDFARDLPAIRVIRVSGLAFHDAGADAADELALMLSSSAAYLRPLVERGMTIDEAARSQWVQVAVGRDTFGELCKLRALRVCWSKLFGAAGAPGVSPPIHAVCSSRTQSQHDPWVNMLRGTTQVFAAALGGADLVTPLSFDHALGPVSAHGRRVARNTALVLREESHLGRVLDAAGGAYYIEARTDALAREAWSRFTQIERDGGIVKLLMTGGLRARLDAAWHRRAAAIGTRKEPVVGVSEFANLDETLPGPLPPPVPSPAAPALAPHRDAEGFEALRAVASRDVVIVPLGPAAEHRARVGFATALFATAGLRAHELVPPAVPDIACLCGSDERYAAEAVAHASELRAAGARKIVLAGRPGALEAELRAAGVDAFIFVGCDVLATLTALVGGPS